MPFTEHHNLDVAFHGQEDHYAVTVNGLGGEFRGSFTIPFAPYEVENFLLKIGGSRGVRRLAPRTDAAAVRAFGERLFDALFHGELEQGLRESRILGGQDERGIRIRLRLRDTPELAALPWEYLYDPSGAHPLAISTRTPLVRYVDMGNPIRRLEVAPPLRVLAVVPAPRNVEWLDTSREFRDLQESLGQQIQDGRVELHGLRRATPFRLREQLGKEAFHVVHFMGHGAYDESTGTGMVVLEDEDGMAQPVSGHDLGLILHDHEDLRMVVLNACEGGRDSQTDPVGGVAQSMVHHDIPAVVGMQAEITDAAAKSFSEAFYRRLGQGDPVDTAMSEARMRLLLEGHGSEWGIPILYLRAHDGRIFDFVDEPSPPEVEELEARADRLRSEDSERAKIHALGLYKRVVDLDPESASAGTKLAALELATGMSPGPSPEPTTAPDAMPRPPPPPARPPDQDDWVPTPLRSSRMLTRTQLVLDRAGSVLGDRSSSAVAALGRGLHEPLRIALVGQVGSGKSTLVNALVGRTVARTDGGAGTRVVTWYRFGTTARARLVRRNGELVEVGLPDGRLPAELPVPVGEADRLEVWLPAPPLRRQTLVDTPGLVSTEPMNQDDTRRALLGHAVGLGGEPISADALVYVFTAGAQRDELRFLARLLDTGGVLAAASINVIGVLGHADLAGGGPWSEQDPLALGRRAAGELAAADPHMAVGVVAVSALMAQAARTGAVRDPDAELLSHLATVATDRLQDWRRGGVVGVAPGRISDLVARCGEFVVARGRDVAGAGAASLGAWMDHRSGVPELEAAIRDAFLARAAALKAHHALTVLARIASRHRQVDPTAARRVHADIERARAHRDLHPIRELEAMRQVSGIDQGLHRDLARVSGGGSVAERLGIDPSASGQDVVDLAHRAAGHAQRVVGTAVDGRARAAARVLTTSYRLLAEEAGTLLA